MTKWRERVSQGLCGYCGKKNPGDTSECDLCRKQRRFRQRSDYSKTKDSVSQKRKDYKSRGLCSRCGKNKPSPDKLTCDKCLSRQKELFQQQKDRVFNGYGGYICNCCGETIREFLTLDHINNDGAKHRKEEFGGRDKGNGRALYKWIIDNDFPDIFQVLCMNCNWGKRNNRGVCPHQTQ